MVLTSAQTTAFFEDANQISLSHETRVKLQEEGITSVGDLMDFDKDTIEKIAANLKSPGDRIPNPDPGAAPGSTIPRPPYPFGAKSQKRLLAACELVRFYTTIGRELTSQNIRWDPVIRNFEQQWKALKARKDADDIEVPKISKNLSIIKWTEAFEDYLHRKIGARTIPLAYVTRGEVLVSPTCPDLASNAPHSEQYGSVEMDLVARSSHNHPMYRDDNLSVYYDLEEATRGTSYAASIKPYQRAKDGRGAWLSIIAQYAGQDKWLAEIKKMDELLHNRVWKGQSNFSLEKFIAQHRNAYVSMQQCAEHVTFQLPNEFTRVTYLVDAIQCGDAGLQAAMALVRADDQPPRGKMFNFEATASYLLPYDPVAKKRTAQVKRGPSQISDVSADFEADVSAASGSSKPAVGRTGVEFRFYKKQEYRNLTTEQKDELREYRKTQGTNTAKGSSQKRAADKAKRAKKGGGGSETDQKKWIAAAVKAQIAETKTNDDAADELHRYIVSVVTAAQAEKLSPATKSSEPAPPKAPLSLQSILKRAKNN